MSASDNTANGPSTVESQSSLSPIGKVQSLVTESVHFVLRLYFSVLLLVYFWFVKVFTRVLQPLEPLFQQMQKIPQREVTAEGIRNLFSRLICVVLLFLAPLARRLIGVVTQPLGWARDKVVEYVEKGEKEALKQTDSKQS